MNQFVGGSVRQRKIGGLAALYLALAYVMAMPYFLVFVKYPSVMDPVKKVAMLVANQASMRVMYLFTYVIFGVVLAILVLALYARMKDGAPVLAPAAAVVGLIWAFVLIASGLVFNAGMAAVVGLHATSPAEAAEAWQAIEPVAQGLGGSGGELLGGLWVLLVSAAALRTGRLSKVLSWLGVAIGAVGVLSVVSVLNELAYAFGMLQIVWFVWLGVAMLRTADAATLHGALPEPELKPQTLQILSALPSASANLHGALIRYKGWEHHVFDGQRPVRRSQIRERESSVKHRDIEWVGRVSRRHGKQLYLLATAVAVAVLVGVAMGSCAWAHGFGPTTGAWTDLHLKRHLARLGMVFGSLRPSVGQADPLPRRRVRRHARQDVGLRSAGS